MIILIHKKRFINKVIIKKIYVSQVRPNSHVFVIHRLFCIQRDYNTKERSFCKTSQRLVQDLHSTLHDTAIIRVY